MSARVNEGVWVPSIPTNVSLAGSGFPASSRTCTTSVPRPRGAGTPSGETPATSSEVPSLDGSAIAGASGLSCVEHASIPSVAARIAVAKVTHGPYHAAAKGWMWMDEGGSRT